MSTPPPLEFAPKRSRRWRRALIVTIAIPCLLLAAYGGARLVGHLQVRAALAEADRLDPGWRFEEIEDQRAAIADQENSALVVVAASKLLPDPWPSLPDDPLTVVDFRVEQLPPERELDTKLFQDLRAELALAAPALQRSRLLAGLPQGRYPISRSPDGILLSIDHLMAGRKLVKLKGLEAALLAQEQKIDEAMAAARGALNAGRSIGDEPSLISQLSRLGCSQSAVESLQRTLAQGQPSLSALAAAQQLLEDEEVYPVLLVALRGERAWKYDVIQTGNWTLKSPRTGSFDLLEFFNDLFSGKSRGRSDSTDIDWFNELMPEFSQAKHLRHMTACIENARLSEHQLVAAFDQLEKDLPDPEMFDGYAVRPMRRFARGYLRHRALLRSVIAALAAERYRQVHGHWPDSLATLVQAKLLRELPRDPLDGAALRFRRLNDGLVIYSISQDQEDNGGKLDSSVGLDPGTDVGFRLWDASYRRQPALPPKPTQHAEKEE